MSVLTQLKLWKNGFIHGRGIWGVNGAQVLGLITLSWLFCALYDPFLGDYELVPLLIRQVHSVFLGFLFLYLCTVIPYAGPAALALSLPFFSICAYVYRTFKYSMGFDLVTAAFETNPDEASTFLNTHSISTVTGYIAAGALIYLLFRYLAKGHRGFLATLKPVGRCVFCACLAALWYGSLQIPAIVLSLRPSLHFRFADNTLKEDPEMLIAGHSEVLIHHWIWQYDNFRVVYEALRERFKPIDFVDSGAYASRESGKGPDIIVLIIGESVRANHLPMNGYHRNTLPELSRQENITFLNNMYTYGTSTYVSVEGIMAGLTVERGTPAFTSFLSILRKHGYLSTWISENTYNIIQSQRFHRLFGSCLDSRLELHMPIDLAAGRVIEIIAKSASKQCIIIENGTGHFPYKHDPKYSPFQPANINWADAENRERFVHWVEEGPQNQAARKIVINEYDNCIACVDAFTNSIIESLKGKNAVLLYCSDHGQKLGENGNVIHGGGLNDTDLRHVGSWIWLSDSYMANNRELATATPALSGKILHQGQIYASILKLCGIESEVPLAVGSFWDDDITKHPNNLPDKVQKRSQETGDANPAGAGN